MDYKKSKVKVACAGAGKTYAMAEEILNFNRYNSEEKDIIAITYTNTARDNIYNNIYKQNLAIPSKVKISTIHSFLLEYIIYPYSNYILGKKYSRATSIPLPDNIPFKNKRILELEDKQIVHNEKVFKLSKQIIIPYKTDNVLIKKKKKVVLEHLLASISSIFVDESQDLDEDIIKVIELLGNSGVFVYMIGDPKQALKYPKVYNQFVNTVAEKKIPSFECLPNNNITRRLPKKHVEISNIVCNDSEKQTTMKNEEGNLKYMYSDDTNFEKVYDSFQNDSSICYIKRKSNQFNTHNKNKIDSILLEEILSLKSNEDDEDAFLFEKTQELYALIENNNDIKVGLKIFLDKYRIRLSTKDYAKLISSLDSRQDKSFNILSIDKVKGLEKENCMFVLDDSLLECLFKIKTKHNKEMNYLYVGLTRSTKNLLLVIDMSNLKKFDKDFIDKQMLKLHIEKYDDN